VEWSSQDFNKFLQTNIYFGTITPAQTGWFPVPIKGTYPASGTNLAFDWPSAAGGEHHANWFPEYQVSGSIGPFI